MLWESGDQFIMHMCGGIYGGMYDCIFIYSYIYIYMCKIAYLYINIQLYTYAHIYMYIYTPIHLVNLACTRRRMCLFYQQKCPLPCLIYVIHIYMHTYIYHTYVCMPPRHRPWHTYIYMYYVFID